MHIYIWYATPYILEIYNNVQIYTYHIYIHKYTTLKHLMTKQKWSPLTLMPRFPDFTNIGAINATVSSCDTISAIALGWLVKLCRSAGWKVGNHQNMPMSKVVSPHLWNTPLNATFSNRQIHRESFQFVGGYRGDCLKLCDIGVCCNFRG